MACVPVQLQVLMLTSLLPHVKVSGHSAAAACTASWHTADGCSACLCFTVVRGLNLPSGHDAAMMLTIFARANTWQPGCLGWVFVGYTQLFSTRLQCLLVIHRCGLLVHVCIVAACSQNCSR